LFLREKRRGVVNKSFLIWEKSKPTLVVEKKKGQERGLSLKEKKQLGLNHKRGEGGGGNPTLAEGGARRGGGSSKSKKQGHKWSRCRGRRVCGGNQV